MGLSYPPAGAPGHLGLAVLEVGHCRRGQSSGFAWRWLRNRPRKSVLARPGSHLKLGPIPTSEISRCRLEPWRPVPAPAGARNELADLLEGGPD
jgi:hypothetical protein